MGLFVFTNEKIYKRLLFLTIIVFLTSIFTNSTTERVLHLKNEATKEIIVNEQSDVTHESIDFSTVISEYTTEFRYSGPTKYRNRASNIRIALSKIDNVVVEPNGIFSFNTLVGPRTHRNGFRKAPTILNGELTEDYGGGVCQVVSTLNAAAIYAGIHTENNHHHSRYLRYIDPGLDATVVYPVIDFTFQNTYSFPIKIMAGESSPGHILIQFLGREKQVNVTISTIEIVRKRPRLVFISDSSIVRGHRRMIERGTDTLVLRQYINFENIRSDESQEIGLYTMERIVRYNSSDRIIGIGR